MPKFYFFNWDITYLGHIHISRLEILTRRKDTKFI